MARNQGGNLSSSERLNVSFHRASVRSMATWLRKADFLNIGNIAGDRRGELVTSSQR
jgi:hypothetical protein